MTSVYDGFNYFLRLEKGEQALETLLHFAQKNKLEGAWISGIGGALRATIGYYDLAKKEYTWQDLSELHEVVSLQGNLSLNESGEPMLHLHGTFSSKDHQVVGGHVKEITVGATLELFIHRSDGIALRRKVDQTVGLPLLDLPHANT
ncbi:MAG TPA: PPC domain-containing DNA-binding protein [Candidatus Saccharimonadales bacterium]|nr:PPC domain-containing DNA-binding protein [Candidatus Saccharimonadales bacterium]